MSNINLEFIFNAPPLHLQSLGYDLGNTLIFAPHPDDESLGCGGLISHLRNQQIPIYIAFITDGAASHTNSAQFPPRKLAALRRKEGQRAAHQLGVDQDHIYFFEQPDGKLEHINKKAKDKIAQELRDIVTSHAVQSIVVPFEKDAHADHRATWALAMQSIEPLSQPITVIEYPIWFWKNGKPEDTPNPKDYNFFRLDISAVKQSKSKAIKEHQSQTTDLINDDPHGFMLTTELLEPFMGDFEYYFFQKKTSPSSLNEDYFNTLYGKQTDPWNFEHSAYEQSKYDASLSALTRNYANALEIGCSIGVLTEKLAAKCARLLAVDISEAPLITARERCTHLTNINFEKMDISKTFPKETFDLILLSEVGYYLNRKNLNTLFNNCKNHLQKNGQLLMVHWTSYVSEYPLTGTEVHQYFPESLTEKDDFQLIKSQTHPAYELVLWEKRG